MPRISGRRVGRRRITQIRQLKVWFALFHCQLSYNINLLNPQSIEQGAPETVRRVTAHAAGIRTLSQLCGPTDSYPIVHVLLYVRTIPNGLTATHIEHSTFTQKSRPQLRIFQIHILQRKSAVTTKVTTDLLLETATDTSYV